MNYFRADNVSQAVELALEMKQAGKYDWFRGQIEKWPLKSSSVRLSEDQRKTLLEKFSRFIAWVKITPGLEYLANHADSAIAVAQHYGLPTNFVDFTTSPQVAGFFASHGRPPTEERESCILCLNTKDITDFWKHMPAKYPFPDLITIEVQNLWRLQAQAGTFLFCPYDNFEHIYDLDCIFFPYTGVISNPKEEEIYPKRKSQLEILLDQYFMNERLIEGTREIQNLPGIVMTVTQSQAWEPELLFEGNSPPKLNSWDQTNLSLWLRQSNENYPEVLTEQNCTIVINPGKEITSTKKIVTEFVYSKLSDNPNVKQKLINWHLEYDKNYSQEILGSKYTRGIRRLWDGLRSLPFDTHDIAVGFGNFVGLLLWRLKIGAGEHDSVLDWEKIGDACFGDAIEIEFGADDGSYAPACVSRAKLLTSVRDDIQNYIAPNYKQDLNGNITGLLQAIQAPDRLFEFDRLAKLFAQEIAPSQVLMRSEGVAVYFSPARITVLGLP
jgi:FRG domain